MKALLLASALALSVGMSAAFASVTIYSDGSTDDSSPVTAAAKYASNTPTATSDATTWHKPDGRVKVVRFGPPESGLGGG